MESTRDNNMLREMLFDFLDNPFDISSLLPAADFLQEQGSPVGDFLALVLKRLTEKDSKQPPDYPLAQVKDYLREHGIESDGRVIVFNTETEYPTGIQYSRHAIEFNGAFFQSPIKPGTSDSGKRIDVHPFIEENPFLIEALFAAIAGTLIIRTAIAKNQTNVPAQRLIYSQITSSINMLRKYLENEQFTEEIIHPSLTHSIYYNLTKIIHGFEIIVGKPQLHPFVKEDIQRLKTIIVNYQRIFEGRCEYEWEYQQFNICNALERLNILINSMDK